MTYAEFLAVFPLLWNGQITVKEGRTVLTLHQAMHAEVPDNVWRFIEMFQEEYGGEEKT